RAGDPASLVAGVDRIHANLDWNPRWNDLDTIVGHALAWEKSLVQRNRK
ncbi:MAG: UDP-glucose 4-epimerase GalE, partial [Phyllobacteriaceae bacterium]|nr:UDP-glucose 4-epimerase GalE [Phyllobacteriaceae bacterium]